MGKFFGQMWEYFSGISLHLMVTICQKGPESRCPKSFGERCALEGLLEGVLSPNAAKSASLVKNVPCRPLCEGYFHQTILNNCPEHTKR